MTCNNDQMVTEVREYAKSRHVTLLTLRRGDYDLLHETIDGSFRPPFVATRPLLMNTMVADIGYADNLCVSDLLIIPEEPLIDIPDEEAKLTIIAKFHGDKQEWLTAKWIQDFGGNWLGWKQRWLAPKEEIPIG